jgi:hypothetical protein
MEETTPLNPNRNDHEDIENPFKMPGEISKFDKECVQECLTITIAVLVLVIITMLFWLFCAILQWNGIVVAWWPCYNNISEHSGNALARVQQVHAPADLWDITFCTRRF